MPFCMKTQSTDGKDKCINKCAIGNQPEMPNSLRRWITEIQTNVLIRRHLDIENYNHGNRAELQESQVLG